MALDLRLPITVGFLAWVVLVTLVRRRVAPGAEGRGALVFIGGVMATAVLWLSPPWAAALAGFGLFVVLALAAGFVGGLIAGAITFGLSVYLPGGASSVLAGLVTLTLLSVGSSVRGRLKMRARSERLHPGDAVDEPVLLEARVSPRATARHPVTGAPVAAWRVESADEVYAFEPARVALQSDAGTVVVDLAVSELEGLESEDHPAESLRDEVRERCPPTLEDETSLTVQVLAPDTTVTVAGHVGWVPAPPGQSYRGGFDVPLFEVHEEEKPFVAARSLDAQRRVDRADLVELAGWVVACVGAAAAQIVTGR